MAGKGLVLNRTHRNGTALADAAHLSGGVVSEFDHATKQSAAMPGPAKASLQALIADAEKLCQSAKEGNFGIRADETRYGGDYREIVQAMNRTLDVVVDKLDLYKTIVDSVPFPIHVIDKDMNWVFLNKAFEKLMVDEDFIKSRQEAPGKPCSTAAATICKTQNCGIVQLNKGVGETYFDWHGTSCKQDTSRLVNAKGEHVGYIEVVQDLTAMIRTKDYTAGEVDRLAGNLTKLAQGDFALDLKVKEADKHTTEVKQQFSRINESLGAVKSAVEAVALDADLLTQAAVEGKLSTRADASKHQGDFRKIVQGVNETLDAILLPIGEGNRILAQISEGKIDELITAQYNGDHEKMKVAVNHLGSVVQMLHGELKRLVQASRDGMLSERGKPELFQGAFSDLMKGVNEMLDAIIHPLNFSADYVERISTGNIPAKITDNYNGDFNKIKNNLNRCIDSINALVADAGMLAQAGVDGKLEARADASQHQGDYKKVIDGMNATLESVAAPLSRCIQHLESLSRGETPALITREYKGEIQRLTSGFNSLFKTITALVADATMLAQAGADGKLNVRADASKHQGDFRKIVQGVNSTLDSVVGPMQDVGAVLTKLAGGDFTAEVTNKYPGDYELLTNEVNTLSKSVRSALGQIGRNVASIAASAEELNKVSQSMGSNADETATQASVVAAAADQVSKNVQTVATGADEMGASIREIAKSTAEATRVASSAVRTAESTNETISKLGQSSAEIGQVIKVITSIAQQTNLLALNATIEAARAGEAGKGFAVVANEVKELAKETAKATEDISQKIAAIQTDTSGAVSAIGQISQVIGQISDIQNTIASAIEEQSATTNEIGRTLAEAAKGSTDITKNIGGVAEAAHATTVGATETLKSAHTLEKMAAELQTLVGQFRY